MQIQIRHDDTLNAREEVQTQIRATIEGVLARFAINITTVEVHLADENKLKTGGNDIRCTLEVRLEGRPPAAVTHHASDLYIAVDAAAEKMERMLDHQLGKLRDQANNKIDR